MRILLSAIALFICGSVFSQIYTPVIPTTYGQHQNRNKADSAQHIPEKDSTTKNTTDTTAQIFINKKDSLVWGYTKARGFFKLEQSGGAGIFSSDTSNRWVGSIYRRIDSVFFKVGSTEYFAFIDSTGGAGGSDPLKLNISDTNSMLLPYLKNAVTNFTATDGNGFDFTVTNPTTTPTLTATTTVGDRQVMFSSSGAISGNGGSTGLLFTTNKQLLVNISEQGETGTKLQVGGGIHTFGSATTAFISSQGFISANTYLSTQGAFVAWGGVAGSITSNQNNYAPTGYANATIFRITTDASRDITGINSTPPIPLANNFGRIITITNEGTNPLVLKANSTSSSDDNRFSMTSDLTLQSKENAIFQMTGIVPGEGGLYRWRLLGTSGTIGSGGGSTETLTNVGSEYELVKPLSGSNYDIKTLKAGINMVLDSATANKIIFHADTATGATKLATQGYVDRSIVSSIPTLHQVTTAGNVTTNKIQSNGFRVNTSGGTEKGSWDIVDQGGGNIGSNISLISPGGGTNSVVLRPASSMTGNRVALFPDYGGTVALHPTISGQAGKVLAVNGGETALEWITAGTGGTGSNLSWDGTNHEVDIDGGGTSAVIPLATGSVNGLLSSTNWTTFNNKQAALVADMSVAITSGTKDSLRFVNDQLAPGNLKVYGTDTSGVKGYQTPAVINEYGIRDQSLIKYDSTTNEYVPIKSDTLFQSQSFITGTVPANGDSIITIPAIKGKDLDIYIDGIKRDTSLTDGYEMVNDSTFMLHPPLVSNEKLIIETRSRFLHSIMDTTGMVTSGTGGGGGGGCSLSYVSFTTSGDLTESPTGTWSSAAGTGKGFSTTFLATGNDGQFVIQNTSSTENQNPIGLDDDASNTEDYVNWECTVYRNAGTYWYVENAGGAGVNSTIAASDGDWVRFDVTAGVIKAQYSTNSGSTWTDIHTYSGVTQDHNLYAKTHLVVGGKKIKEAKVCGFE